MSLRDQDFKSTCLDQGFRMVVKFVKVRGS